MDEKVRALGAKAWTQATAIGGALWDQTYAVRGWAQKKAAPWTPARIIKRRQRARQWALVKDMASVAAAYGARAAVRKFLPAPRQGHAPAKS